MSKDYNIELVVLKKKIEKEYKSSLSIILDIVKLMQTKKDLSLQDQKAYMILIEETLYNFKNTINQTIDNSQ